jgi:hypothetical protein
VCGVEDLFRDKGAGCYGEFIENSEKRYYPRFRGTLILSGLVASIG